ncbi:hypothetical protein [Pigmentiphaga sp. D-2]|uniref:hypothetical protein n=1 Tax=Pigmentiphaga sp. D-2 TaxID=1002116 RepID=UPI0014046447|nr:hypothetical protein [Pigmentiphaga sp. D-2]
MKHSAVVVLAVVVVIGAMVLARQFYRRSLCEEMHGPKACILYDYDLEKIEIVREMWKR